MKLNSKHKALLYWVALLTILLFMTSCRAKKPTHEVIKIDSLQTKKLKEIIINRPINDKIFVSVPEVRTIKNECDSLANDAVLRALKNIKGKKTSGLNSYEYYFDTKTGQLVFDINIGETEDKKESSEEKQSSFNQENKTAYIDVYPKWLLVLAGIGTFYLGRRLFRIYKFAVGIIKA